MSENKELTIPAATALAINNWDDLLKRSEFFAKSALIPVALRNKPADVAIILQMGMELGLSQMQSLNSIDVIQGKPTIPPQLGLAMCRSRLSDFSVEWKELTETKAVVILHRGKESYPATWDTARAQKLGLLGKQNYQQQQGTMLKWRAVGEGLRAIASDILKGCYLEGELDGMDGPPTDPQAKVDRLRSLNQSKPEMKDVDSVVVPPEVSPEVLPNSPLRVEPTFDQNPRTESPQKTAAPKAASWDDNIPTTVTAAYDPLGDYVLQANHSFKDIKIKDVPREELVEFLTSSREHFQSQGKVIAGLPLQDLTRIDDYLRTTTLPGDFGSQG